MEASESVEVRARIFGYLKSIEFKDGDFVTEGQLLFTIEPDEYKPKARRRGEILAFGCGLNEG